MRVNIISINPVTAIPLLRYIVHFFIDRYRANVVLTEVHVKSFNNYYQNINHFRFDNIAEYATYEEFRAQPASFKISKYFQVIRKILSIYNSKQQELIYTNDYQVLYFILKIKQFFNNNKILVIYQQYELVEPHRLNKINHFFYASVLKKANTIDLTLFSEINRLNYFCEHSTLLKEKAFVLPNSCNVASIDKNIKKHALFQQFADDAFIVAHLGNVGGGQHYFSSFIKAVTELESNKKIVFIFIGRKNELINQTISEKKLTNLFFIDAVPHEELNQIYPFIDLGVILYKGTSPNYEFCAPNKLYELWANGVPVIGHQLKGLIPLFDTKEKGVLSNFDDATAIATSITNYANKIKNDKTVLIQLFKEDIAIDKHFDVLQQQIDLLLQSKKHKTR